MTRRTMVIISLRSVLCGVAVGLLSNSAVDGCVAGSCLGVAVNLGDLI
jgi:hypothetical protein